MNITLVDRIVRLVVEETSRRAAIKALAGSGLLAVAKSLDVGSAQAKKTKKKRCRKRTQSCGGRKKCCKKSGLVICDIVSAPPECASLTQDVCCGQDGAPCNPELLGCDCCGELFCVQYETESLCRSEAT